jgi:hypothetical protein
VDGAAEGGEIVGMGVGRLAATVGAGLDVVGLGESAGEASRGVQATARAAARRKSSGRDATLVPRVRCFIGADSVHDR